MVAAAAQRATSAQDQLDRTIGSQATRALPPRWWRDLRRGMRPARIAPAQSGETRADRGSGGNARGKAERLRARDTGIGRASKRWMQSPLSVIYAPSPQANQ